MTLYTQHASKAAAFKVETCSAEPDKCFCMMRSAFVEHLFILAILVANGSVDSAYSCCYLC